MQNKNKFTSWHFDGHGVNDVNGRRIAKCNLNQWKENQLDPEFEAVSNLISAAPDMLEALQYLIQWRPGEAQFDRLYETRVNAARIAIAKAIGD